MHRGEVQLIGRGVEAKGGGGGERLPLPPLGSREAVMHNVQSSNESRPESRIAWCMVREVTLAVDDSYRQGSQSMQVTQWLTATI